MDYQLNPVFPFMQNDDWVYYYNLENFLAGDFRLHELSGASFYVQGLIAYVFSIIFGPQYTPYLTVFISLLSIYIFYTILKRLTEFNREYTLLFTLLFALNPLFVYSSIGFMTENYLLLFVLLSIKYVLLYNKSNNKVHLFLALLFSVLSFGVKQTGIFLPIAYTIYFALKKKYTSALISLVTLITILGFYEFIFPKTPVMEDKGEALIKPPSPGKLISDLFFLVVYISALCAPGIIAVLYQKTSNLFKQISPETLIKLILAFPLVYLYFIIRPDVTGFLFFDNTFLHSGFFPAEILGAKYTSKIIDNIFKIWEWAGLISLILLILNLNIKKFYISKIRNNADPIMISIIIYTGIILSADIFFDRYILTLIPLALILIARYSINASGLASKIVFGVGIFTIGFISYNFAADFILGARYTWSNSLILAQETNIQPNQIGGNRAWTIYFEGKQGVNPDKIYRFAYDDEIEDYTKISEKEIKFPGSLFINPKIYLHKSNSYITE